jgi:hypothetical protein
MNLSRISIFKSKLAACLGAIVLSGALSASGIGQSSGVTGRAPAGKKVLSADGPNFPPQLPTQPPKAAA